MNKQEIFNKVAKHLLTQKEKSAWGDACRYRGPRGLKCAIGCLIPDELYDPAIENVAIGALDQIPSIGTTNRVGLSILQNIAEKVTFRNEYVFCEDLQKIHDLHPVSVWKQHLEHLGEKYRLDLGVLYDTDSIGAGTPQT